MCVPPGKVLTRKNHGPHKQSILRNKEVPKKNAPHKPRDVTRPTVMVKRYGFRGTLAIKYKIDFWNNTITASVLVWNQVVLNQSQQLGYLNSKLMLSWDCPFKAKWWRDESRDYYFYYIIIPEVGGLGLVAPEEKGCQVSQRAQKHLYNYCNCWKKNSPREVERAHFRYMLVPPGPTQEMKLMGPGREGPSRSSRFLQPCLWHLVTSIELNGLLT